MLRRKFISAIIALLIVPPMAFCSSQTDDISKWEPDKPKIEFATRMYADLEGPRYNLGKVSDAGIRRIIPITGGTLDGPLLKGELLNVGADWQMVGANGISSIEAKYVIKTIDGALINVSTKGIKYMSPEIVEESKKGPVHPSKYFFKQYLTLETSDAKYEWVNRSLFIGTIMTGGVYKKGIVQDIYLVK